MLMRLMTSIDRWAPKRLTRLKGLYETLFLWCIYARCSANRDVRQRINHILQVTPQTLLALEPQAFSLGRELPSNPQCLATGWSKWMIGRYLLAMHFSRGKRVLEVGSGMGWGAYLLDAVAREVLCTDVCAGTLKLAQSVWPTHNCHFTCASALQLPFEDRSVDVATAMEVLEHLSFQDIGTSCREIHRVLRSRGIFIGTSYFPETREQADQLCNGNPDHKYILTRSELAALLHAHFSSYYISQDKLWFLAMKGDRK